MNKILVYTAREADRRLAISPHTAMVDENRLIYVELAKDRIDQIDAPPQRGVLIVTARKSKYVDETVQFPVPDDEIPMYAYVAGGCYGPRLGFYRVLETYNRTRTDRSRNKVTVGLKIQKIL